MTDGIILYNEGNKCLVQAMVCLDSLRKQWSGSITFFLDKSTPKEFEEVCKFYGVDIVNVENNNYVLANKSSIFALTPYDRTVWMDLDTLVIGKIDELFGYLDQSDISIVIPHFAFWWSDEKIVASRLNNLFKTIQIDKNLMDKALQHNPAINTGVVAFKKNSLFINDWVALVDKHKDFKTHLLDELIFQVLYPSYLGVFIAPTSFNVSAKIDRGRTQDKRIIHYHGKRFVEDIDVCLYWKQIFEEMLINNVANIKDFMQYADKKIVTYAENNNLYGSVKMPNQETPNPVVIAPTENTEEKIVKADTIDKNDDSAFRHARDRHSGSVNNEYRQNIPFFFTREGAAIDLIGQYKGTSAFLICNGPSFIKLDRKLLDMPGIMTFGINNGPKTFRPNFWTCVDDPVRFLKSIWLDSRITKFVPQSHFEKPIFDNEKWEVMKKMVGDCPNVIGYRRNEHFIAKNFLREDKLNWGNHKSFGGGRSVMLPAFRILHLLGFRKVYLLGCDMKMTETYAYHFDEQRSKGAVNCNMSTYDRLKNEYLPQLKPYFDAEGFNVFNCNPESELKVFPFVSFEDAVKEATKSLGNVPNERVWGMYSTPDEKDKWKKEPPKEQKIHLKTLEVLAQTKSVQSSQNTPTTTQTTTTLRPSIPVIVIPKTPNNECVASNQSKI